MVLMVHFIFACGTIWELGKYCMPTRSVFNGAHNSQNVSDLSKSNNPSVENGEVSPLPVQTAYAEDISPDYVGRQTSNGAMFYWELILLPLKTRSIQKT